MTKKQTLAGLTLLVIASLILAACSAQQATPDAPTVDANAIYTQAAETVQAGIAQTEAVQPPTAAPTETAMPTNTMDPNIAAALTATSKAVLQPAEATATVAPGQPTLTKAAVVSVPTATSAVVAPPPKATGDKAELVGQDPADGSTAGQGDVITMNLTLKNTGTTTWSTAYTLVYYAGDRMDSPADFNMPHEVKPGETVTLVFALKAPSSSGNKTIIWSMRNADGVNFYPIYFKVTVN